MQYEYKVFTEGNYDNKDIIEDKLNKFGKEGWKVFHIERINKGDYWEYPKSIYYLMKEIDENITITK
jgi:hypothetical protein